MTTYPLPTLSATVTPTGISAPSYVDILLSLEASYRAIYGADTDLDPDTQDGNWIAVQAAAINDANQVAINVYLSFSPSSAQGAALSSVVKVNGITRMVPSASSTPVLIVGQAGSIINNGLVGDNAGLNTRWNLPASVTIPPGGSITTGWSRWPRRPSSRCRARPKTASSRPSIAAAISARSATSSSCT